MTKNHSTRRQVLKTAALGGAATALSACGGASDNSAAKGAPAIVGKKRALTMVTAWPKNFPGTGTGVERLAKRIEALSGGQITVKVFAAGELVGGLAGFDAVSGGQADMYHAAEYYWQGKSPAFNFFAAVPFGMTANEQNAWIRFGGGQELWDELSAPFNIKPFMAGNSGTQMGGWYNKDINTVEDFRGLRIRMPGLGGEVMRRLGATPVTKSGGEIFQALSQGNIDATEWIGPWNDLAFGFHTIVKNYYYPGIHEPGPTLSLGLNKGIWDDMSAQEKAIIQAACDAENDIMHADYNYQNGRALIELTETHGVQLKRFSDDILRELGRLSLDVVAETADADPLTRRIYDSYQAGRRQTRRYQKIGERAFADARDLIGDDN